MKPQCSHCQEFNRLPALCCNDERLGFDMLRSKNSTRFMLFIDVKSHWHWRYVHKIQLIVFGSRGRRGEKDRIMIKEFHIVYAIDRCQISLALMVCPWNSTHSVLQCRKKGREIQDWVSFMQYCWEITSLQYSIKTMALEALKLSKHHKRNPQPSRINVYPLTSASRP